MSDSPANPGPRVRRVPRFKVNFAIRVFTLVRHRGCVIQGRSHDLCEDGMAIYIPAELEMGQTVQVEFLLPDSQQRLGISAIVRNCQGFRCGIQFDHLTIAEQKALEQCCERLATAK